MCFIIFITIWLMNTNYAKNASLKSLRIIIIKSSWSSNCGYDLFTKEILLPLDTLRERSSSMQPNYIHKGMYIVLRITNHNFVRDVKWLVAKKHWRKRRGISKHHDGYYNVRILACVVNSYPQWKYAAGTHMLSTGLDFPYNSSPSKGRTGLMVS